MPQHSALHSSVHSAINTGSANDMLFEKSALQFQALGPSADGTIGVEPLKGQGSAAFTRSGLVAHVRDHNNVYRLVQADEARIQGARRVENLLTYSDDLDNANWVKGSSGTGSNPVVTSGLTDHLGGNAAWRVQLDIAAGATSGDLSFLKGQFTNKVGHDYARNLWIKSNTEVDQIVRLRTNNASTVDLTVTSTWTRYSGLVENAATADVSETSIDLQTRGDLSTDKTIDILISQPQIEDVSGASSTAPSEYIPTEASAATKYFWRTNGNSVVSNVVTEAQGIPLHPIVRKENANVLARYATRANSEVVALGARRITANGSGPAGGNGFVYECVVPGTTSVSEPTFDEEITPANLVNSPSGANWTDNGDGSYTHTPGSITALRETLLEESTAYLTEYTITDRTTGSIAFNVTGDPGTSRTANGTYTEVGITIASGFDIALTPSSDFDGTVSNIIIRKITDDGTVGWRNMGHYKLAGYLGEPAATNSILQSRAFDTTWILFGAGTSTQDQDGIDGVANTAWTMDDSTAGAVVNWNQSVTIPNDSNTVCSSIFILKDTDTTRFPSWQLNLLGGTAQYHQSQINTQTGELATIATAGTVSARVEDHGLWWRLIIAVDNNSTGNVSAQLYLKPADGNIFGSELAAATGTTVFDQAQLELNTSVPSSPIVTTTVAVTRNADDLSYQFSGNMENAAGTILCAASAIDWGQAGNTRIIGSDTANGVVFRLSRSTKMYDGTNLPTVPNDASIQDRDFIYCGGRWSGAVMQAQNKGNSSAESSYDGSFDTTTIYVGSQAGNAAFFNGIISDIRIYKKDLGQTVCESLTSPD